MDAGAVRCARIGGIGAGKNRHTSGVQRAYSSQGVREIHFTVGASRKGSFEISGRCRVEVRGQMWIADKRFAAGFARDGFVDGQSGDDKSMVLLRQLREAGCR